jgi:Flp pilus assembly protein TadD
LPEAWKTAGAAEILTGDFGSARAHLQRYAAQRPDDAEARQLLDSLGPSGR